MVGSSELIAPIPSPAITVTAYLRSHSRIIHGQAVQGQGEAVEGNAKAVKESGRAVDWQWKGSGLAVEGQ